MPARLMRSRARREQDPRDNRDDPSAQCVHREFRVPQVLPFHKLLCGGFERTHVHEDSRTQREHHAYYSSARLSHTYAYGDA